ncbi:MAG: AbrB/MazE/SpoVT family DNA-binding domain-containing protein, partial [Promethearchaeota archaeon]
MSNNITRKLIKWGSSQTLIISLPRIWVKQNNLRAEQSVRLQINPDGSLMIIPLNQDAGNMEEQEIKATISIRDPMDLDDTKLRITTKYLDGADLIELNTSKEFPSDIAELLEPLIEPLMGLEIIGVSSNRIIIRNIVPFSQTIYLIKMIS